MFVALGILNAKRLRRNTVASLSVPYFLPLSHKRHDFRGEKKKLLNTKCVFWYSVQILSGIFLILRITERDIIINIHMYSCEVPVILVRYSRNCNFLNIFSESTQMPNYVKIYPILADLFRADVRKDMTKVSQFLRTLLKTEFRPNVVLTYAFLLFLPTNSDYFFMQLIGLRDGQVTCLLWGRNYFSPHSIYINFGLKCVN